MKPDEQPIINLPLTIAEARLLHEGLSSNLSGQDIGVDSISGAVNMLVWIRDKLSEELEKEAAAYRWEDCKDLYDAFVVKGELRQEEKG